jgi:hypothetical protein
MDTNQTADELNLEDVFNFLYDHWKRLVIAALVGACLGLGGWFGFVSYKAESVLINNGAFSFMSWRGLQKNLPILASQIVETQQLTSEQEKQYRRLADAAFFQKNVVPTYSLTKADTKDIASISKELQEEGGTKILNLVMTATGSTKEVAESNVDLAIRFIKEGSAYLAIKNLINGYETKVLINDAEFQKKIIDAEVDLKFMSERAKNLELLRQRFPANVGVGSNQIVDVKDSNAKYMPISTQLVAINTDINNTLESLQRTRNGLLQSKFLRDFVTQAKPVVSAGSNGLALVDALLKIEIDLRQTVKADDINGLQILNDIEADLVTMRTHFTKGLESDILPQLTKPSPILFIAGGLFVGAFLQLLFVLIRKVILGNKLGA